MTQEPVMWVMPDGKTVDKWGLQFYGGQTGKPLYAQPPKREWVGLTDKEIEELANPLLRNVGNATVLASYEYFAKAIEAKLKEKNT